MLNRKQKGSVVVLIPIVIIVVSVAAAFGIAKFSGKEDGVIEEKLESVAEDAAEDALGLPDGALEGKFDVTPSSKEK